MSFSFRFPFCFRLREPDAVAPTILGDEFDAGRFHNYWILLVSAMGLEPMTS